MRSIAMLCTALVTGCAAPAVVTKEGQSFDYRTSKPASSVAACIKRNADEMGSGTNARLATNLEGDPEVVIRNRADGSVIAIAQVVADRGTRVNALITQYTTSAASVANGLVNDCL